MADTGIVRLRQQAWQRANIMAVAGYLREVLAREPGNARVQTLYDGLLEVMEPARRALRQQRGLADASAGGMERRRASGARDAIAGSSASAPRSTSSGGRATSGAAARIGGRR